MSDSAIWRSANWDNVESKIPAEEMPITRGGEEARQTRSRTLRLGFAFADDPQTACFKALR
jgi:hypothetical protein